jgi:hypothetical protein
VSGLGERGTRLRRVARQLDPAPAVPPFYVQVPDEEETRAVGWYMRRERGGEAIYLGHSAIAAELHLRRELDVSRGTKSVRKKGKKRIAP